MHGGALERRKLIKEKACFGAMQQPKGACQYYAPGMMLRNWAMKVGGVSPPQGWRYIATREEAKLRSMSYPWLQKSNEVEKTEQESGRGVPSPR